MKHLNPRYYFDFAMFTLMAIFMTLTSLTLQSCMPPTPDTVGRSNVPETSLVPAHSQIPAPVIDPTKVTSSVEGTAPGDYQFPHWFIQTGYEKGGRPWLLFLKNGSIWMREETNKVLIKISQTWNYDS